MAETHKIARLTWQTAYTQFELAEAVQNQISRWSHQHLSALLNQQLERHCDAATYWQIETLELDLGPIAAENLLEELPRRLSQQLELWLTNWQKQVRWSNVAIEPGSMAQGRQARQLDTLSWFLHRASYPWWHDGRGLAQILTELIQNQAPALRKVLLDLAQSAQVRWRLVRQFTAQLPALISVIEPAHAVWIVAYVDDLLRHQKQQQILPVAASELEQKLWFTVLTQLLMDRGSLFNQADFLRGNLMQLAQEFAISYAQLLEHLGHILTSLAIRGQTPNRWYATLAYLQQQQSQHHAKIQSQDLAEPNAAPPVWQALHHLLWHLCVEYQYAGQTWQLSACLKQAIQINAKQLARRLRSCLNVKATSDFLCCHLDSPELYALLKVLAPSDYPFIQVHISQHHKLAREKNWQQPPIWNLVLGYLLASGASYFNRRQFVAISLQQAAKTYAVDRLWLLDWMILSLQSQHPHGHRFELLLIFQQLRLAFYLSQQTEQQSAAEPKNELNTASQQLRAALQQVAPPTAWSSADWGTLRHYSEDSKQEQALAKIFAVAARHHLDSADLARRLLRISGSAASQQLWQLALHSSKPDWPAFSLQLQELAQRLLKSRSLLKLCRQKLSSIAEVRRQLTILALTVAKQRLSRVAVNQIDTSSLGLIRALILNLSRISGRQAEQFSADLYHFLKLADDQYQLRAYPWFSELQHSLARQVPVKRLSGQSAMLAMARQIIPKQGIGRVASMPGHSVNQQLKTVSTSLGPTTRQQPDTARHRKRERMMAYLGGAASKRLAQARWHTRAARVNRSVHLILQRLPNFNYLLADSAQAVSAIGSAIQSPARRKLWHLLLKHLPELNLSGGRLTYPAQIPGLPTVSALHNEIQRSAQLTEARLLQRLHLPAFIRHSRERLQQLHKLIRQQQLWYGDDVSLHITLTEVVAELTLAFRGRSISETEFYFRVLRLMTADHASQCADLFGRLQQATAPPFWRAVVQRHQRKPLQAASSSLNRAGDMLAGIAEKRPLPQIHYQQDYQQAYLRQPATLRLFGYWLQYGRFPDELAHAGNWSIRRLWQEALDYGFTWRKMIASCNANPKVAVARILSVLDYDQVQKLLASSSGISRNQLSGLRLWQHGLAHLSAAERKDLLELWQFDLVLAWWRGDNQGFHETRLVSSLAQFLYRKRPRQRQQLVRDLLPVAKRMPTLWREAMLQLLAKLSGAEQSANSASAAIKHEVSTNARQGVSDKNKRGPATMTKQAADTQAKDQADTADLQATAKQPGLVVAPLSDAAAPTVAAQQASQLLQNLRQEFSREAKSEAWDSQLPIAIRNAGLVLLNGFIPSFFERLQLTQGNQFSDLQNQQNAALYLHYLSTGVAQADEAELMLNKLLVGLAPEQSLPAAIDVDVSEVELCNSLLHFAIQSWSAIGSCSVDGFRGNWLIRNASLSDAGDYWRLVVERRAYDLLLARSPYSYSLIRLPWMKKAIYVTWPT